MLTIWHFTCDVDQKSRRICFIVKMEKVGRLLTKRCLPSPTFQCQPRPHHIYGGPESSLSSHSDATGFWWTQDTKTNYIKKRKPEQSEFQLLQFFPSWQWVVVQLACCVSVFFHLLLSNVLLSWIQISPSITWWYIHHLLILHNASQNAQGDVRAKVRESIGKKKIVKTVS